MSKPKSDRSLSGSRIDSLRDEHIGRLFMMASRIFERISLRLMQEAGYTDLRMVHLAFLRNVRTDGSQLNEIAGLSNMTKQAASQLANELEELGYISKEADPKNGRAKVIKLTSKGRAFFSVLPDLVTNAEAEIAQAIGTKSFTQIKLGLHYLVSQDL